MDTDFNGGAALAGMKAPHTQACYSYAYNRVESWINESGRRFDDQSIADFILDHAESDSSARQYMNAVNFVFECRRQESPCGELSAAAVESVRRRRARRPATGGRARAGVLFEDMQRMVKCALEDGRPRALMGAALFNTMFDGLLRIEEAVGIDYGDIDFGAAATKERALCLRHSKDDQYGRGVYVFCSARARELILNYRRAVGVRQRSGPVFLELDPHGKPRENMKGLTVMGARKIIKEFAGRCRLRNVNGHSFRIGCAQSMAQRQKPLLDIMADGRWKTPSHAMRYIRGYADGRQSVVNELFYGGCG